MYIVQPLWKMAGRLLKKLKQSYHLISTSAPGHISEENEHIDERRYHDYCSITYNSQDMDMTQVFTDG